MFRQSAPRHLCHWYAYEIGAEPRQIPGVAVSVSKILALPAIVGTSVLTGAIAVTGPVSGEAAAVGPLSLLALTIARTVEPMSAAVRA
jgi:hypothetical protein